ncbi:hypothetical protein MD484_g7147, partial [Candolleomyces efflorescens]
MIAVSFPAVSDSGVVRVPTALFFIGKHFGTGVILATAFIHLLPDSFHALLNESVSKEYGNVGRWTGLIILGSLLTIFLVEYISTTFVDHLHAEPSAPPSLQQSPNIPVSALPLDASPSLLPFLANAPKIIRLRNSVACVCQNGVCVCIPEAPLDPSEHAEHSPTHERHHHEHHAHSEHHHEEKRRVGRRRQIVGIFVLQVGIMIHSVVIGLTLSITSGADFTSLTTAIIFHQIFEGLSLGIRIAALPHNDKKQKESDIEERHGSPSAPSISELEGLEGITVRPDLQGYGGEDGHETQRRLQLHLQSEDRASMKLTQGVMSAISAGMLIYAATVEMIAGDFVFGDLEGHHHHGPGGDHHHHEHEDHHPHSHSRSESQGPSSTNEGHAGHHPSIGKRVVAVLSLLMGVVAMVVIGLGEPGEH